MNIKIKIKLQIAGHDLELTVEQLRELRAELDKLLPPRDYSRTLSPPAYSQLPAQFHAPAYPNNPITCATQFHPN